jgi:hypothetical protein
VDRLHHFLLLLNFQQLIDDRGLERDIQGDVLSSLRRSIDQMKVRIDFFISEMTLRPLKLNCAAQTNMHHLMLENQTIVKVKDHARFW